MVDIQIRLEELLGREIAVRWYEGVAVVQAVTRQLRTERFGDVFPTAAEIVLAVDGTVAVLRPTGAGAVRTAARHLAAMLSDDVPVRLRLIVAQATGAEAAYPTLDEFSSALEYFERPDSAQVLRGLVERAMLAPARVAAPDKGSTPVLQGQQAADDGPTGSSRTHLRLVVGAAVTAGCFCVAWLGASAVGYGRLGMALTSLASGPSSDTSDVGSQGRTKATAAVGTVGGTRTQPRQEAERSPEQRAKATAKTAVVERTSRAVRNSTNKQPDMLIAASLPPLHPMTFWSLVPALESRPVFGETVEVTASEPGPNDELDANGARIYSRGDAGVMPPRSVYPKLPSDATAEEPDNRTILELVIGANGLVERAKLRSIPRDIHEFMLVSAAKAWIFEPATIDGLAVRYRHQVRIMLP